MTATSARGVALEAIRRVIDEGAYSSRVLPALLGRSDLDVRDRAFATDLTLGTLRRKLVLDRSIALAARRPVERITPAARHALRLGAYQLLEGNTPAYAAVAETVSLVPGRERGFVNGVLRSLAASPPPAPVGGGDDAIAGRTGLADWAVDELRELVGNEAEAAAAALASKAPLSIRVIGGGDRLAPLRAEFQAAGIDAAVGPIDESCLLVERGDPRSLPGFERGAFAIQDQASAFVVRTLDPRPGDRVLDTCAAPGGKAIHAAELVRPGGWVLATDVNSVRVGLIRTQASRLRQDVTLLVQDARRSAVGDGFDRVLVDAPCSGIGSARRRPELLWRVRRQRLPELAARQLAIISAAADVVRDGGRLVYAVCTMTRAETDAVCDAVMRARSDLEPIETPGPDGVGSRHRLWPHRHGCDGMFVASFRRVA
jgi:16S rRNA (cytosine967-C5)-methyltransferase